MVTIAKILTVFSFVPQASTADDLAALRDQFIAAEAALDNGQPKHFRSLRKQLLAYPLLPYLDALAVQKLARGTTPRAIGEFLDTYPDFPLRPRLKHQLIRRLAEREAWKAVVDRGREDSLVQTRCTVLRARLELGEGTKTFSEIQKIWLSKRSRPTECDIPFQTWIDAGALTEDVAWQRTALALKGRQWTLARYLRRFLGESTRKLLDVFMDGSIAEQVALLESYQGPPVRMRNVLVAAIDRTARTSPPKAVRQLQELREHAQLPPTVRAAVAAAIGEAYARRHDQRALSWLTRVPPRELRPQARNWQIITAARHGKWREALNALGDLEREQTQWDVYWRARALAELGQHTEAGALYASLAKRSGYYGFMAANRIGQSYALTSNPVRVTEGEITRFARRAGARRAFELVQLERWADARREWRALLRDASRRTRAVAAVLAKRWNWHAQAILSAAESDAIGDLELRFPTQFESLARPQARRYALDLSWVFAVIRQESAFMRNVGSSAGAVGLMQLLPSTARAEARLLNRKRPSLTALKAPELNIQLGVSYLARLYRRFDASPPLTSAAYNAGPSRARRWQPKLRRLSADIWIDSIPFQETRRYLRRVLSYAVIYDHLLGRMPRNLTRWMGEIAPRP